MIQKNSILFYIFAVLAVVVDQVTKHIARSALENRTITVIRGFFDLQLSFNHGAAFGILPNWTPFFIIIALVAIYWIMRFRKVGVGSKPLSAGMGLVLGGAAGNLIDRVTSAGNVVTDFISLHLGNSVSAFVWPTFNVADIAIVAGALLVFFHVYVVEKRKNEQDSE